MIPNAKADKSNLGWRSHPFSLVEGRDSAVEEGLEGRGEVVFYGGYLPDVLTLWEFRGVCLWFFYFSVGILYFKKKFTLKNYYL